jgi:hypothetical protein
MMNINIHTDGVKEFYTRGHAHIHEITKSVYTVLQIGVKTNEGYNDIFIYPSISQLEQIKQAIEEAIEEAKKLNERRK